MFQKRWNTKILCLRYYIWLYTHLQQKVDGVCWKTTIFIRPFYFPIKFAVAASGRKKRKILNVFIDAIYQRHSNDKLRQTHNVFFSSKTSTTSWNTNDRKWAINLHESLIQRAEYLRNSNFSLYPAFKANSIQEAI